MIRDLVKTLIVDADELHADHLTEILSAAPCYEYDIDVVPDFRDGLSHAKMIAYDLVIIHDDMPEPSIPMIQAFHAIADHACIIVFTADVLAMANSAADEIIRKNGVTNDQIRQIVRDAVCKKRAKAATAGINATVDGMEELVKKGEEMIGNKG